MNFFFAGAVVASFLAILMLAGIVIVSDAALGFNTTIAALARRAKQRERELHDSDRRLAPAPPDDREK